MNKSSSKRKKWNELNITTDVGCVVDLDDLSETLEYVEYVWENMLENEKSCDLEKQVGNHMFCIKNFYFVKTIKLWVM